jgi:hypothetical protein
MSRQTSSLLPIGSHCWDHDSLWMHGSIMTIWSAEKPKVYSQLPRCVQAYRMRFMQYYIPSFVFRYQPAPTVLPGKFSWVFRQQSCRHHIRIKRIFGFLFRKASVFSFLGKFCFNLLANRISCYAPSVSSRYIYFGVIWSSSMRTVLKIDKAASNKADVPHRHPRSDTGRFSVA